MELTAGDFRWQISPECRERLIGPEGLRLQEWLESGQASIVKHGPHRTVYRVNLSGFHFHLKHHRLPNLRAWLRQLVRPPKARMEYERALALTARGIPTIIPLGVGEECTPRSGRQLSDHPDFSRCRAADNVHSHDPAAVRPAPAGTHSPAPGARAGEASRANS